VVAVVVVLVDRFCMLLLRGCPLRPWRPGSLSVPHPTMRHRPCRPSRPPRSWEETSSPRRRPRGGELGAQKCAFASMAANSTRSLGPSQPARRHKRSPGILVEQRSACLLSITLLLFKSACCRITAEWDAEVEVAALGHAVDGSGSKPIPRRGGPLQGPDRKASLGVG